MVNKYKNNVMKSLNSYKLIDQYKKAWGDFAEYLKKYK